MNASGKVYIVILNWNRWQDTIECLSSVLDLDYPDYSVILIDNGSADPSVREIEKYLESLPDTPFLKRDLMISGGEPDLTGMEPPPVGVKIHFLAVSENLGFPGGNNLGISYADTLGEYEWLYFLNNDTVVEREALSKAVTTGNSNERVGFVGSKLLYYRSPNRLQGLGIERFAPCTGKSIMLGGELADDGRWEDDRHIASVIGAAFLVRSRAIRSVGPMDGSYFLYGEDIEWCLRSRKSGWEIRASAGSRVRHKVNASLGRRAPVVDYYSTINILRLVRDYFPTGTYILVFLYQLGRIPIRFLRGEWANVMAVFLAYFDMLSQGKPRRWIPSWERGRGDVRTR